jgi:hypothetical protein
MARKRKDAFSFTLKRGRRRDLFTFGPRPRRGRRRSMLSGAAFGLGKKSRKRGAGLFSIITHRKKGAPTFAFFRALEPPARPAEQFRVFAPAEQTTYTPRTESARQGAFFVTPEQAEREPVIFAPWYEPPHASFETYTLEQLRQARQEIDTRIRTLEPPDEGGIWAATFAPPLARKGQIVRVFGTDPSSRYDLQYEIVELGEIVASNTLTGTINPDYPEELQPRDRSRAASRMQIQHMAAGLDPDALLTEFHTLDRGAPIIGPDNAVESGNGRILALMLARDAYPEQYERYRAGLLARAAEMGIDASAMAEMNAPVLVRRRVSDVDRITFAQEANQAAVLAMSTTETAGVDAQYISDEMLEMFQIGESQSPDQAIRSSRNADFVRLFMGQMPETERAALVDATGDLTQAAVTRIKGAMFAKTFGRESAGLGARIFESVDNDIKSVTNGVMSALVQLAKAERLAEAGQRSSDLTIAADVAVAIARFASLKDQGMSVDDYLMQGKLFEEDLTPTQITILEAINDRARSSTRIKDLLFRWYELVEASPNPNQMSLFGEPPPTREELVRRWI